MNFEKLFSQQVFKHHICNPFQSSSSLSIRSSFFICCRIYFFFFMFWAVILCFTEFGGGSYRSNFEKFRDAAPLRAERTLIPPSLILLVVIVLFQCESLERDLLEKDSSISTMKTNLASLKAEHAGSSSTISHLEATIRDKDKHIEILQGQRQRSGEETDEELGRVKRAHEKLEGRLASLREQLSDKEV